VKGNTSVADDVKVDSEKVHQANAAVAEDATTAHRKIPTKSEDTNNAQGDLVEVTLDLRHVGHDPNDVYEVCNFPLLPETNETLGPKSSAAAAAPSSWDGVSEGEEQDHMFEEDEEEACVDDTQQREHLINMKRLKYNSLLKQLDNFQHIPGLSGEMWDVMISELKKLDNLLKRTVCDALHNSG